MRSGISLLRRFIRESMVSLSKATSPALALALAIVPVGNETFYVLYQTKVYDVFRQAIAGAYADYVVAMMRAEKAPATSIPQWGASTVTYSAARKGYGPLMYDIVMSREGRLIPDRESVSRHARNVWRYYKDKRPDVRKLPLDDVRNPHTPSPEDDAYLHRDPRADEDGLNNAYELTSSMDVSELMARHEVMVTKLAKTTDGEVSRLTVNNRLCAGAREFFKSVYVEG